MPHLDWRYNPDTPLLARSPWSERAIDGLPRRVLDLADAWYRENDDTTALQCGYDALRLIEAMSTTGRADARANALSNEGNLLAQIEGIFCRANSSGVPRVLVFPVGAQGRDIFQRFTSELCDDSHERRVTHLAILQARAVDSSLTLLRRLRAPLLGPWIDHSIALRLLDYRSELACSDQPGLALSVPVSSGPAFPAQPINLLLLQPADPYVSQLVMDTRHIIRIRHQMAANLGALNCFSYDEAPALQGLASLLPPATQPSPGPAWPGSDRSILSAYDLPVAPPATMPSLDRFAPEVKAYEDELRDQLGVPAQRDRIAAEVEAYEQMKRGLNQPVPLNGVNVPNTFHGDLPATASPTSPATDR